MTRHLESSDPLRFERRGSDRTPASGSVMAVFTDRGGRPSLLARIDLVDTSPGGLGFRSPVAVQPGESFTLYSGTVPVSHGAGTVARCVPDGREFRLGARCDRRRAA